MPAGVILGITVTDPDLFEEYRKIAPAPSRLTAVGRFKTQTLEPNRVVILEFDSTETAKNWLNSPEYRETRSMRLQAATSHTIVVEGV